MAFIKIVHRLHPDITGGGKWRTVWSRDFSPSTWINAIRAYEHLKARSIRDYGDIGAGWMWAWLEEDDGSETSITLALKDGAESMADRRGPPYRAPKTVTEARERALFINDCSYVQDEAPPMTELRS